MKDGEEGERKEGESERGKRESIKTCYRVMQARDAAAAAAGEEKESEARDARGAAAVVARTKLANRVCEHHSHDSRGIRPELMVPRLAKPEREREKARLDPRDDCHHLEVGGESTCLPLVRRMTCLPKEAGGDLVRRPRVVGISTRRPLEGREHVLVRVFIILAPNKGKDPCLSCLLSRRSSGNKLLRRKSESKVIAAADEGTLSK